ncbi:uncharacterized protein LOC143069527 [Mytilus galloprovincialis]|uniref:uncharacterized protein LOC143069527 n=1 Tax=Mytilus galloprovincialis TaxID=29158 RepID=UPI003F7B825F
MIPLKKGSAGHDVFAKLFRGNFQLEEQIQPEASFSSNSSYVETEESGTAVVQTGKITKSEKLELEFSIQEDMRQEILEGNYKMAIAPSDLVDFGGQKSYDMTHQLFIQCKGTFVLMFDGRYGLYDALVEYKPKKITTMSILKHWIDSILTYCVDVFVDEHKLPKILFAATHGDAFPRDDRDERKAMFIKELTKIFSSYDLNEHIIYHTIFFFDARNQYDPEMQNLTRYLVDIAFEQPSWGQQMPVAWVPLELQISEMKTVERNFVRKSELQKVNEQNGDLALTDSQFEHFLRIQHSLGKLLYFGEHGINNFIVVQPSALVNVMRSFVTDEMFWPKDDDIKEILPVLSRTGVIRRTDLYKLWEQTHFKQLVPSDDLKKFIIEVLIHLDILVEPKQYNGTERSTEFFLVPCMIKEEAPTAFLNMEEMADKMICLSYRLKKSSIPAALIFKLIGSVLNVLPIKEQDGRQCLYYQAAAFSIDDNNECRMHMKGDRIVINLINKVSRLEISPDIAASLQECLTFALTNVLQFYYACIGKDIKKVDILKLFDTEVGVLCCDEICFITLNEVKKRKTWTCEKKIIHETHLYWILDETIGQDECPPECEGFPAKDLSQSPNDKHLVRLASELNISHFNEFLLHLGLKTKDWEKIEYNWGRAEDAMVVALLQWKESNQNVTFKKILDAQESIADNRHHLCQVFKGQPGLLENTSFGFQDTPDDRFLSTLSRKLGNCVIQLGIELGLTFSDIEAVYVKHPKDLFSQMYEVLKIWKQKTPENTYLNLMLAIQRVRGKQFLKRNFCCVI